MNTIITIILAVLVLVLLIIGMIGERSKGVERCPFCLIRPKPKDGEVCDCMKETIFKMMKERGLK